MDNVNTNAGALPSNAGDDFHLLWAAEKLLNLLYPNSDLTSVTVEGPAWQDSVVADLEESKLYSIDLAEYYGGETVHTATRIVFSQLKYSTYMGNTAWTASSLCQSDNKKKTNSVIRRLADTYEEYTNKFDDIKDKLTLKLVSNRPISESFKQAINEAKKTLHAEKPKNTNSLINSLSETSKTEIKKLYEESKLKSLAFLGCIKAINFEDCGADTRSILKAKIIQQLGHWGIDSLQNKYNEIIMTLREQMMYERNSRISMTKDFVCSIFGGNYMRLFPAPTSIPEKKYVERECSNELIKTILQQDNKSIFVHATAGIGKTTLVNNLHNYLPDGSAVVFYDCYGGGTYLQPADSRYDYDTAILQICNTLALECKTDFLLERRLKETEFWYELSIRLTQAAKYTKSYSEDAIVLLIIDAADNSVFAAEKNNKVSFVHKLLQQPLPDGVKTLLTYRTEHTYYFNFPHNSAFFEVPAFNLQESTEHVNSYSLELTQEALTEFHHLSRRIPRVQSYVLAAKQNTPNQLVDMLLPNGKNTEDLLRDILEELRLRYGERNDVISFTLGVLINMPRPIPMKVVTKILDCSPDMLQSLSVDYSFGLYIENDFIYFRDEDFETFLREKYCDNSKSINTITEYLYQHRHLDAYCAKHVHSFLSLLNDGVRLLDISLNESIDEAIIDVTEASRIMLSRIKSTLSLPLLKTQQYSYQAFQLIYKSIDFSKSDEAIIKLIKEYPEQASLYCDKDTLLNIFTTERNDFKSLGKAVFVFSMDSNTKSKALSYLDSYRGAFNYFYSKQEEEQDSFKEPRLDDTVNIADSVLRLKDASEMKRWITVWSSKKLQATILFKVVVRLFNRNDLESISNILRIDWPTHCMLSIVAAHLKCKKDPPIILTEYLIRLFSRSKMIDLNVLEQTQLILFLEYLLSQNNVDLINNVLSEYQINTRVSYVPYIHREDEQQIDLNIRLYVLKKTAQDEPVNSDDFVDYDGLNKDLKHKDISERVNEIKKVYNLLLPAYKYRIMAIKHQSWEKTKSLHDECVENLDRLFWSDRNNNKIGSIRLCLLALADGVLNTPEFTPQQTHNHLSKILNVTKIYRETKLALSNLCAYDRRSHQFSLEIIKSLSDELVQHPTSAPEAYEFYVQCAQIGQRIQISVGQHYFDQALQAAKGLDYESYKKLELLNIISFMASEENDLNEVRLSHEFIRLSEDFYRKMWDSKHFPYKEVFNTATQLCPMNIFSIMCRLDDRDDFDHFSLPESAFHVLKELLRIGVYPADIITSLATILLPDQPSDYVEVARYILSKLSESDATIQQNILDLLIQNTLFYVPLNYKNILATEIAATINKLRLTNIKNSSLIVTLNDFLESISKPEKDIQMYLKASNEEEMLSPKEVLKVDSFYFCDAKQLTEHLKKLDSNNQTAFVGEWLANSLSESFVINANILLESSFEISHLIYNSNIQNIFIEYLNKWSVWPDVAAWRNNVDIQRKIFISNMYEIIHYPNYYDNLIRIFNCQPDDLKSFFIEYLILEDNLSSESIIEILKRISAILPPNMAMNIMRWCITTEISNIHPKSGDQPFCESFSLNDEALLPISKLLWRMLGHPDKKLRLNAAHIIESLYSSGYSSIINNLISLYKLPFDQKYIDEKNFFFYDSAKLFFLITCHRIFLEEPHKGEAYYCFFKEIACSNQVIHALQRRFAKLICLRIAKQIHPNDIHAIEACDELKCGTTNKKTKYARANSSSRQQFRFHFDYMDTLPNWYNDLANIFVLTQEEVAKDCDIFIHKFNINNDNARKWRDDFIRYNRYRNRNTLNSHGSLPEIETLDKYAEWHAMFYVADQYRCTLPYIVDTYYDYHQWLDSFLPGYQGYWTSEYRTHIPYIPFLWEFKKYKNPDNEYEYMIPPDLVQSLIVRKGYISSHLDYHSSFDQSSQSINIQSALIGEENITKLIAELKKPHTFFDDFFEADPEERMFRKETDFSIKPINDNIDFFKGDRLDEHDSFAKNLSTYSLTFADDILNFVGLKDLNAALLSLPSKNPNLPLRIKNWSEPSEDGGYYNQGTYGSIAEIDMELFMEYLNKTNKALVLEYKVTFEDQTYQFYGTPSKTAKEKGIFVIRSNGNIESHLLDLDSDDLVD